MEKLLSSCGKTAIRPIESTANRNKHIAKIEIPLIQEFNMTKATMR